MVASNIVIVRSRRSISTSCLVATCFVLTEAVIQAMNFRSARMLVNIVTVPTTLASCIHTIALMISARNSAMSLLVATRSSASTKTAIVPLYRAIYQNPQGETG